MTPLPAALARRAAPALAVLGLVAASVLATALPAAADVPEGWSDPEAVDPLFVILVAGGIPLLLALVITALVYGPPLARGERVAPGAPAVESQWLGGPRKAAGELAGPDGEDSQAGGSGGRW